MDNYPLQLDYPYTPTKQRYSIFKSPLFKQTSSAREPLHIQLKHNTLATLDHSQPTIHSALPRRNSQRHNKIFEKRRSMSSRGRITATPARQDSLNLTTLQPRMRQRSIFEPSHRYQSIDFDRIIGGQRGKQNHASDNISFGPEIKQKSFKNQANERQQQVTKACQTTPKAQPQRDSPPSVVVQTARVTACTPRDQLFESHLAQPLVTQPVIVQQQPANPFQVAPQIPKAPSVKNNHHIYASTPQAPPVTRQTTAQRSMNQTISYSDPSQVLKPEQFASLVREVKSSQRMKRTKVVQIPRVISGPPLPQNWVPATQLVQGERWVYRI